MKSFFSPQKMHATLALIRSSVVRFPQSTGFIFALTLHLGLQTTFPNYDDNLTLYLVLIYYFSVGALLSLSIRLWEEEAANRKRAGILHGIAHVLLLADAVFLYNLSPETIHTEIAIAHGAAIFALVTSIFFLPFMKEKSDVTAWNFGREIIHRFFTSYLIGGIMCAGLALLLLLSEELFGIRIGFRWYEYTCILTLIPLPFVLFLGRLPRGEEKHDPIPYSSPFLLRTIRYLFLPLIGCYLAVIYVYAARILLMWELPNGWISWLVTVLMAGVIAIEVLLYPLRKESRKPADERIARLLPLLTLPLLVLMSIGLGHRLGDYGITINRLYLLTLNVWFYYVCLTLFLTQARRIHWIFISFSLLFLLTSVLPVNYASITRNVLTNNIREKIEQTTDAKTPVPFSKKQYNDWLASLPEQEAVQINDKMNYLEIHFGRESIDRFVEKGFALPYHAGDYISWQKQSTCESSINQAQGIPVPQDYNRFFFDAYINFSPSEKYWKAGTCAIPLPYQTDGTSDTIFIPIRDLQKMLAQDSMPTRAFPCNTPGALYIPTRIHLRGNPEDTRPVSGNISGYLFKK